MVLFIDLILHEHIKIHYNDINLDLFYILLLKYLNLFLDYFL